MSAPSFYDPAGVNDSINPIHLADAAQGASSTGTLALLAGVGLLLYVLLR